MANQYTIKQGDTLGQIAQQNKTTVGNLMSLNPQIKNPNLIYAGQPLTITAENLTTSPKPIETKPFVDPNVSQYQSALNSGTAMATAPQQTTPQDTMPSWIKDWIATQEKPKAPTAPPVAEAEQKATLESQKKLDALNAELLGITNEAKQAQLQIEGQASGKDVTTAFLGREQEQIARNAAIKSLPLQGQILAQQAIVQNNQGLLKLAEQKISQAYQLQTDYENRLYDYRTNLIKSVWDFANQDQQRRLQERQKQEDRDFQIKRDELAREHDISMEQLKQQSPGYQLGLQQKRLQNQKLQQEINQGVGGGSGIGTATKAQLGTINDVNNIIDDTALTSTFGWSGIVKRNIPGSPEYNLKAKVTNLIDRLSLAARGQLKGQGTVSDFEGKMLKNAQTALKLNMSPEQALQQLVNVRGAIATSSGMTATVEVKDLASGQTQLLTADQAGINKAIADGLLVTYK